MAHEKLLGIGYKYDPPIRHIARCRINIAHFMFPGMIFESQKFHSTSLTNIWKRPRLENKLPYLEPNWAQPYLRRELSWE